MIIFFKVVVVWYINRENTDKFFSWNVTIQKKNNTCNAYEKNIRGNYIDEKHAYFFDCGFEESLMKIISGSFNVFRGYCTMTY